MKNETGRFHKKPGMCCNVSMCNGNMSVAPVESDPEAQGDAELQTFVCDYPVSIFIYIYIYIYIYTLEDWFSLYIHLKT
jgi:hypothetical protein